MNEEIYLRYFRDKLFDDRIRFFLFDFVHYLNRFSMFRICVSIPRIFIEDWMKFLRLKSVTLISPARSSFSRAISSISRCNLLISFRLRLLSSS